MATNSASANSGVASAPSMVMPAVPTPKILTTGWPETSGASKIGVCSGVCITRFSGSLEQTAKQPFQKRALGASAIVFKRTVFHKADGGGELRLIQRGGQAADGSGVAGRLNLGNVGEFAFDKKGDWLACLVDARDKAGNGVLLRNMATGSLESLDHAEAVYKGLTWTEKGDGFATVRGVDDKGFEDKLYSVVAFKGLGTGAAPAKFLYDPKTDQSFPVGMTISAVRNAAWRDDLTAEIGRASC